MVTILHLDDWQYWAMWHPIYQAEIAKKRHHSLRSRAGVPFWAVRNDTLDRNLLDRNLDCLVG